MVQNWRSKTLQLLPLRARKLFISGSASKKLVDNHEFTNCATLDSDKHQLVTNQFPFLQLPLELRVLIYKKIIPDEGIWCNFAPRITTDHLENLPKEKTLNTIGLSRKDGDVCCPEILCLNSQIYHEVIPLWYGAGELHLWLMNEVNCMGQTRLLSGTVPSFLKFVTSLRIYIYLPDASEVTKSALSRQSSLPFLTALGDFLAKNGNLKQLNIGFSLHMPTWFPALAGPSELLSSLLESNLRPFRNIPGLLDLTTDFNAEKDVSHRHQKRHRSAVERKARIYLDTFEFEMLHATKSKYRRTATITHISPLLQLPEELRLLIYKYLVPDGDISPIRVRERPETLRKDGGSICPAVLYLSRQIYNEVIPLWYGSGNFHSELWDFSVRVPSALRFVKSLNIPIFAEVVPQKGMPLKRQGLPNYYAFIVYFLEKHGILERLTIRLTLSQVTYGHFESYAEALMEVLSYHLSPFRNIGGLSNVTATIDFGENTTHDSLDEGKNFMNMARKFLDQFESDLIRK